MEARGETAAEADAEVKAEFDEVGKDAEADADVDAEIEAEVVRDADTDREAAKALSSGFKVPEILRIPFSEFDEVVDNEEDVVDEEDIEEEECRDESSTYTGADALAETLELVCLDFEDLSLKVHPVLVSKFFPG